MAASLFPTFFQTSAAEVGAVEAALNSCGVREGNITIRLFEQQPLGIVFGVVKVLCFRCWWRVNWVVGPGPLFVFGAHFRYAFFTMT